MTRGWIFVFVGLGLAAPRVAAGVGLDPTFGTGGIVTTAIPQGSAQASKLVQEPDGRLVVVGWLGSAPNEQLVLARYTPDGALDPSFGTGGIVVSDPAAVPGVSFVFDAVAQPDGAIVVGGLSVGGAVSGGFLARFGFADGSLDASFGTGGVTIDPNASDGVFALGFQSGGRLVAVTASGSSDMVVRYDSHGTRDSSFGSGGASPSLGDAQPFFVGVAVRSSDDEIFVGSIDSQAQQFVVSHLTAAGAFDPGFGGGAPVTTPFPGTTQVLGAAVVPLADGRLLAIGSSLGSTGIGLVAARYLADGSLDPSFGTGGRVATPLASFAGFVPGVTLQPDGKLLVATFGGAGGVTLLRYDASGALDPTFGAGGMLSGGADLEPPFNKGASMVLQASGKPVVAGSSCDAGGNCALALLRFVPGTGAACGNGTIDPGEQCDDGTANGSPASCCTTSCTRVTSDGPTCGAQFSVPPTIRVKRIGSAGIPLSIVLPDAPPGVTRTFAAAGFADGSVRGALAGPPGLVQVTKTVHKKWRGRRRNRKVSLELNATGKKLLKRNGSLAVTIQQQLTSNSGGSGAPGQSLVQQVTTTLQSR
jgi:uncharacterized delta-60 repeat protein